MLKSALAIGLIYCCLTACAPTSIHRAVHYNDLEAVQHLVSQGDINQKKGTYGHTPLIISAWYGYTEIAQYLCEHGADVNIQGHDGATALIYATRNNYYDIVDLLLFYNASVAIKDKAGLTALDYAKQNQSLVVPYLMQADAKQNRP